MATRSAIGVYDNIGVLGKGKIHGVYCHWDGYPEHNGKILMQHYPSSREAMKLIKLGDMSFLGTQIGKKHPFDKFSIKDNDPKRKSKLALLAKSEAEGWTTYFGRDRGEQDVEFKTFASEHDFVSYYTGCEFFYCLKGGVWSVKQIWCDYGWTTVENYLKEVA